MSLDLQSGQRAADEKAVRDASLYATARQQFGGAVGAMRGDAPVGLLLGHVLRVDPSLSLSPPVQKDRRVGFMKASVNEARTVNIRTEQLQEMETCAFVYGREINRAALSVYTTYTSLFTEADENFWKCAYLYTTLGSALFTELWNAASPGVVSTVKPIQVPAGRGRFNWEIESTTSSDSTNKAYDDLLYVVNNLTSAPPGWRLEPFKRLVLLDCEYVYALWRRYGASRLEGFGTLPVLQNSQMRTIMNRVK